MQRVCREARGTGTAGSSGLWGIGDFLGVPSALRANFLCFPRASKLIFSPLRHRFKADFLDCSSTSARLRGSKLCTFLLLRSRFNVISRSSLGVRFSLLKCRFSQFVLTSLQILEVPSKLISRCSLVVQLFFSCVIVSKIRRSDLHTS